MPMTLDDVVTVLYVLGMCIMFGLGMIAGQQR